MADIVIELLPTTNFDTIATHRCGPFWISPTVGYVVYVNSAYDLKYQKTVNGPGRQYQIVIAA